MNEEDCHAALWFTFGAGSVLAVWALLILVVSVKAVTDSFEDAQDG